MDKPATPRGIARLHPTVKAAGWVSFFTDFSSDMIYPLLPIFLKSVLHSGTAFIGLIEGAAETTASFLKLFSGYLSDRWKKRKPLVLLGYSLSSLARPLVAAATAGWHVLALRVGDRVGKGLRASPRDALVADVTPPEDRGIAFGFQRAMDHAGAFIGPLAAAGLLWLFRNGGSLPEGTALRWVFLLAAVPGLLAPLIIWRYIQEPPHEVSTDGGGPDLSSRAARALPRDYWKYLGALLVFTLGNSSDAFLVLRAAEAGVAQWQIPILWAALHFVKTFASTPGGRLSDVFGRRPVILLGWVIYATCYVLFGLAGAAWQIWAIFLVYGLYHGCTEGTERALVADLVPAGLRGTAFGFYNAAIGLAALPASVLFGAVWQWTGGPLAPFLMGAGFAALAIFLLALVRTPPRA
ncbi:MAG: MFS transporter [Kiritimatiellae bacterium]|nr:MFS transporter [Kiritimatiellia bacterium]